MKYLLIFTILFFVPFMIFSEEFPQYLEPEDINIFINNYHHIIRIIEGNIDFAIPEENLDNYYRLYLHQIDLLSLGMEYFLIVPGKNFLELLDHNPPNFLEEIFKKIGWMNNGNKKFWTIYVYYWYLRIIIEQENQSSIYGVAVIYHRSTNNPKILETFNSNDLDIIKSYWNELLVINSY